MLQHEENDPLMEVGEAVKYLAEKWGIAEYKVSAFKMLRYRWNLQPALSSTNTTFWRKSQLDAIPQPDKSKPRGPRKKKEASSSTSLMLLGEKADEVGERLSPFEERRCHLGGSTVERLSYALREAALA